ncbi:peptidase S24 [Pseudomonas versuta]|uniref:Peptidase S24 n=1 Tax=Pseudomonas versuta TaxID=1788301 RepID=A0A853ZZW1_9PSED|nr:S24 family peptidase [Pseudomonas versuta]OKA29297.1 peptidase S24 [Pseudomonas versuta]
MVDKNDLRVEFSSRLHEALDDAGVRSHGRGVDIQKRLKSRGVSKTTQAISKWLKGEAMAEADSMTALCDWLKVRREWLEYGVLPKGINDENSHPHLRIDENINETDLFPRFGEVPLISWEQAGIRNSALYTQEEWLPCPVPISPNGYALRIVGDSMTNPGPGRSYPIDCIIFVDPEVQASPGDRVIARVPRTNDVTFKVLTSDAGKTYLRPINPQYPIIDITDEVNVCGKVIGAFIPE